MQAGGDACAGLARAAVEARNLRRASRARACLRLFSNDHCGGALVVILARLSRTCSQLDMIKFLCWLAIVKLTLSLTFHATCLMGLVNSVQHHDASYAQTMYMRQLTGPRTEGVRKKAISTQSLYKAPVQAQPRSLATVGSASIVVSPPCDGPSSGSELTELGHLLIRQRLCGVLVKITPDGTALQ